jgi:putative PIG3 family NAD(P)H quinone oxidoreductase
VSGTVAAVGANVRQWHVDDPVCALVTGGGYATWCVAPARQCLPAPVGIDLLAAAAIPETFFTVWTNVFERGRLKPGETVLIHGGSSGIGTTAIQIASARGSTVLATAGSDEKCRACEDLGATQAINYRTADFVEAVRELTGGRGVDLILDMVGGDYLMRNIRSLALEGRLVQIAFLKENKIPDFDAMPIMVKRLTFTGSTLRPRTVEQKAAIAKPLRDHVWPLFESGQLKTFVYQTFPLAEARAAHELMESSQHIGKIVLTL